MLRQVIPSGATVSRSGRVKRHPKIGIPAPEKNDLEMPIAGFLSGVPQHPYADRHEDRGNQQQQ
jgi:hypothetical protein